MEELHRPHKDVPFGWVLWLQELFAERARKAAVREARPPVARLSYTPDDLHSFSGPH